MRTAILISVLVLISYCAADDSSCKGRCGQKYDPSQPCGCNDACKDHNDCCDDYDQYCGGGGGAPTDAQIKNISNVMSLNDVNAVGVGSNGVQINLQAKASGNSDKAPQPLITSAPALTADTAVKFLKVRSLYNPDVNTDDRPSTAGWSTIDAFLDAVLQTTVMGNLQEFLQQHDLLNSMSLKDQLKQMWFSPYSRSSSHKVLGSSGFEHSFLGEVKGDEVEGFHNWMSFMIDEMAGAVNYYGYIRTTKFGNNQAVNVVDRFTWLDGSLKSLGGYLVGTSVEYDMAVFTLCWLARPDSICEVQLQGTDFKVQTYVEKWGGKKLVGSAYAV